MTVAALQRTMSSEELTYWMAYDHVEPFGVHRGDLNAAIVAQTMARCMGNKGAEVKHFIPSFSPKPRPIQRDLKKQILGAFAMLNSPTAKAALKKL